MLNAVIQPGNVPQMDSFCIWKGIYHTFLKEKWKNQKEERQKALEETNQILESVDEEIQDYRRQIEYLTKENAKLQAENQGLKAKLDDCQSMPLLYIGNEKDIYSGEVKDIILSVLEEGFQNIDKKTRRAHILKDIIETNHFKRQSQQRANEVKKILKDYKNMDGRRRQTFTDLGFEIIDGNKHYKLVYGKDGRYTVILGKTPSDGRAGQNNAAIIKKLVY